MINKVENPDNEEICRAKIIESIEKNRPVIAFGIIGPPDPGVIAGYDRGGQVLFGRSYSYDSSRGYYEKDDWYENCFGLVRIGDKKKPPEKHDICLEALKWAVRFSQKSTWLRGDGVLYSVGLNAYDAWVDALRNDSYFPLDDMDELTQACLIHSNTTLSGLFDSRGAAVRFLKSMIEDILIGKEEILKAAAAYKEELSILGEGMKSVPYSWHSEEKRRRIADPNLRSNLADLILKAKEKEIRAVEHIKNAIVEMESK